MVPVAECNEGDKAQGAYFAAAKKKAPSLRDVLHWLRCGRFFFSLARAREGDASSARTSRPRRRALPAPYRTSRPPPHTWSGDADEGCRFIYRRLT